MENIGEVFISPAKEIFILDEFREDIIMFRKRHRKSIKKLEKVLRVKENIEYKFGEILEELKEKSHISNIDMLISISSRKFI